MWLHRQQIAASADVIARWHLAIFTVCIIVFAPASWACGCRPSPDRYFLACRNGKCESAFLVTRVGTAHECGSRSQVLAVDRSTDRFLSRMLEAGRAGAEGLFEIEIFNFSRYGARRVKSFEEFKRDLQFNARARAESPQDIASLPPSEAFRLMEKIAPSSWLMQTSQDASAGVVEAKRVEFERIARDEYMTSIVRSIAEWTCALLGLSVLFQASHVYFRRLHTTQAPRSPIYPVVTQVSFVVAGFLVLWFEWNAGLCVFLALVAIVLLLAEGWAGLLHWLEA